MCCPKSSVLQPLRSSVAYHIISWSWLLNLLVVNIYLICFNWGFHIPTTCDEPTFHIYMIYIRHLTIINTRLDIHIIYCFKNSYARPLSICGHYYVPKPRAYILFLNYQVLDAISNRRSIYNLRQSFIPIRNNTNVMKLFEKLGLYMIMLYYCSVG